MENKWNIIYATFIYIYLSDAFIQSDLQYIQVIHFLSVFPENWTHNLLRC